MRAWTTGCQNPCMTPSAAPAGAQGRRLDISDVQQLHTFTAHHGSCFDFSPDGNQLAFCKQGPMADSQRHTDAFLGGIARGELYIVDLTTFACQRVASGFECFMPAWSPCGQYVGFGAATADAVKLAFVRSDGSSLQLAQLHNLDFSGMRAFAWLDSDTLACVVPPDHQAPHIFNLDSRALRKAVVAWDGLAHGDASTASAWSTHGEPAEFARSADDFKPNWARKIVVYDRRTGQSAPAPEDARNPLLQDFVQRTEGGYQAHRDKQKLRWRHGLSDGTLVAVHEPSDQALFLVQDGRGTRLVLCGRRWPEPAVIFETNTHLEGIEAGRCIDLQTTESVPKRVRVLLPPNHETGQPLPAVMYVYPGHGPGDEIDMFYTLHEASQFNLQLLAARGYAVIEPTLALPQDRAAADLPRALAAGARAAAQACIEAGLVDPQRLHVMGHSQGGWATMSLLTTTDLFCSGIALAGVSNAISLHGACDPRFRYDDAQHTPETAFLSQICEAIFGMPGPPEQALERYVACSPALAASKVQAPLLIAHADQDFFPLSQAEEMYAALRRLGKPATLVRYWGEGHLLAKPANIADLWTRIFAWLEQHATPR